MTAAMPPVPDTEAWAAQTTWWSERYRSRPLLGPAGLDWFSNDPLRPTPHTHPNASEVFFVCSGQFELTVGREALLMGASDYVLVPPDTYHSPLNVGDTDVCVLVVVAPNWRHERLKPQNFVESDFAGRGTVVSTDRPGPLPSDERISSEVIEIEPAAHVDFRLPHADHLLYVCSGTVHAAVDHLGGGLSAHQYVHASAGAPHRVTNRGDEPARLLSVWTAASDDD